MKLGAAQFVRAGSFLAGLAVAAILVAGWRVPTQKTSGAHLQMVAVGTSELRASPAHSFLSTSDLHPGSDKARSGQVTLTNTMEQPLAVRFHAVPDVADLDHTLRVKASVLDRTVYAGTLGGLRSWTRRAFVVPMHAQAGLRMRVWMPKSLHSGFQNREAKVTIEFKLAAAGRAG
jgi:hypothetical protein